MKTGTFSNEDVRVNIKDFFVPLKYESGLNSEQFSKFSIVATPTFVVLDSNSDEVYRMIGYYNPEDFIGQLTSARQIAAKL